MKEIKINFNKDTYEEIKLLVDWLNTDNYLSGKEGKYTVEEFIIGSASSKVEEMTRLIPSYKDSIDTNTTFKNRFKEIAKERNIKQVDIANKLGMHKSNLSTIFNNKEQPRSDTFFKIWALLGCPPIYKCIEFKD